MPVFSNINLSNVSCSKSPKSRSGPYSDIFWAAHLQLHWKRCRYRLTVLSERHVNICGQYSSTQPRVWSWHHRSIQGFLVKGCLNCLRSLCALRNTVLNKWYKVCRGNVQWTTIDANNFMLLVLLPYETSATVSVSAYRHLELNETNFEQSSGSILNVNRMLWGQQLTLPYFLIPCHNNNNMHRLEHW